MRRGSDDAVYLVEAVGDHLGELLVCTHSHHRDQVGVAGDRVDLGDLRNVRDGLCGLRDTVDLAADHDNGGDHELTLPAGRACVSDPARRRLQQVVTQRPASPTDAR